MTMTAKDFILIASVLSESRIPGADPDGYSGAWNQALDYAAEKFAIVLSEGNPRFQRDKFLTACGVEV